MATPRLGRLDRAAARGPPLDLRDEFRSYPLTVVNRLLAQRA